MELPANSYCAIVASMPKDSVHQVYHDSAYGFPIHDDNELFGRLILEINQAGLNWTTILNKQKNFREAYSNYDIQQVAKYDELERERLLADKGIIRNRLKVNAAIHNAQVIARLQDEFGSFEIWLDHHHPLSKDQWVKLFKKTFKFTGGEITNEFLMSTGYLPGSHAEGCPIGEQLKKLNPKWLDQTK
jgi:DNA-3-methyladenine glycosylase I